MTFENTVRLYIFLSALLSVVEGSCRHCIKCGDNDECLEGCKPGFAGRTCEHPCSYHCLDSLCDHDESTGTYPCTIGCKPGYYGFQCNTPCQSIDNGGKCDRFNGNTPDCHQRMYGKNCETSCQPKCGGIVCDNKGKCFKEFCKLGRYGAACSKHCEAECGMCHRNTGKCLKLNEGAAQEKCNNGYYITTILLAVFFLGTVLVVVVWSRCRRSTDRLRFYDGKESIPLRQNDGVYILTKRALGESFLLNCTDIRFSKTKYNDTKVHINAEGELINTSQLNPLYSDQRLKNYRGTSSIDPLPRCVCTQYFEVKSRVDINDTLSPLFLLLEIGLAAEDDQDQSNWIGRQPNSYSLSVQHCPVHNSVCRHVRRHGEHVTCLPDTLENKTGISVTLHYGVIYNCARNVIAFLDVENEQIIGKIDMADNSLALWPMFEVNNAYGANLRMSLVVGKDIDMTDHKRSIIKNVVLM